MATMAAGREVNDDARRSNARLAWILVSTAVVFALGFVAKVWLLSH
jgi:hypothetical protein